MWWRRKKCEEPVYESIFNEQNSDTKMLLEKAREQLQPDEELESQIAKLREVFAENSDQEDFKEMSEMFEKCVDHYRSEMERYSKMLNEEKSN